MKTEIVKMSPQKINIIDIKKAAEIIKSGGLVAFPTETVYGLGGDGTNPKAAKKIYEAKGRPSDNPLIIHIAEPHDAEKYTYTNALYYSLAEHFMPGPLTVVLVAKDSVPMETRGGLPTVAVRCPSNKIANKLIRESGIPIAAPSANLSGKPSPTKADHVIDDMSGRVDMIIDGGDCDFGLESTIVKIDDEHSLTLLRPGKITAEELSFFADVYIADAVTDSLKEGETALSPGMKYRHYAPKSPLILLDGKSIDILNFLKNQTNERIAILYYNDEAKELKSELSHADIYELGEREDMIAQAHQLFSLLREADKHCYDKIYAPLPEKKGVGLALYNRMIRAAAHTIIKL